MNTSALLYSPECDQLLKIYKFNNSTDQVKGFFLKSTAPENVEDDNDVCIPPDCRNFFLEESCDTDTIVNCLATSNQPEIVVRIHGYSTPEEGAIKSYHEMIEDIKNYRQAQPINIDKTFIFLGYRWPSEKPNKNNWREALPILPTWILGFSVLGIIVCIVCLLFDLLNKVSLIFFSLLTAFLFFAIIVLILLRFTAYFRDTFRATNYGVPDLVELIRTLDEAVINHNNGLGNSDKKDYTKEKNKIKLSFIAHSMGSYVTTNTVRILSNVFTDPPNNETSTSYIGNIFSLGRLILVAPDIPVETIMPRRANFLQSSLERFEESYIFSNEGDIVLRIASTAANYFSFPARDRFSGYRLGNITVKHSEESIQYGISNLDHSNSNDLEEPFEHLEIRSVHTTKTIQQIAQQGQNNGNSEVFLDTTRRITDKFTYFDCTNYTDTKNGKKVNPIGLDVEKKRLNACDYLRLFIDHLVFHKFDTHGGYFDGYFSRELMYKLAFLGFEGLLQSYSCEAQRNGNDTLSEFSQKCKDKKIKVVLSS